MKQLTQRLKDVMRFHAGWVVLACACGLTAIGVMAIQTTDLATGSGYAMIQLKWVPLALFGMVMVMVPRPRDIGPLVKPMAVVALLLLFFLITPFTPEFIAPTRNGARCWYNLRFMMFQPAEVAKVIYVMALAFYLRRRDDQRTLGGLFWPVVMTCVPMGLLLLQPDLGSALLFPPALVAVLIAAGARIRHVATFLGLGIGAVIFTVMSVMYAPGAVELFLKPHQIARIRAMISQVQGDERYVKSIGFQQAKSMDLIGSGGLWGYGLDQSRAILKHNRLPEQHNDMIFAVIVNRWGLAGASVVIGLFTVMFMGILTIGAASRDPFVRLTTVGVAAMLFAQVAINVGMCIGLMPITGLTLPFISYGGSSLLTSFMIVGLMMSFASDRTRMPGPVNFDYIQHEPNTRYT